MEVLAYGSNREKIAQFFHRMHVGIPRSFLLATKKVDSKPFQWWKALPLGYNWMP